MHGAGVYCIVRTLSFGLMGAGCIILAGDTAKLLRGWRVPFRITEVHQGGRYYHLSNGNKAHYEILKPHFSGINEFEVDVEDISKPVKTNQIIYLIGLRSFEMLVKVPLLAQLCL